MSSPGPHSSVRTAASRPLRALCVPALACLVLSAPSRAQSVLAQASSPNSSHTPTLGFIEVSSPTGLAGEKFGSAVTCLDFNGDGALDFAVGAPGTTADQGVVYVYLGPNHLSTPPLALTAFDAAPLDHFGYYLTAIDLDGVPGDELVVGANWATVEGHADAGAVYVCSHLGTQTKLVAGDVQPGADFGSSCQVGDFDLDGNMEIAVSARAARRHMGPTAGKLYFFEATSSSIDLKYEIACPEQSAQANNANFGARHARVGSANQPAGLVVSRMGSPVGSDPNQGAVDWFPAPLSSSTIPVTLLNTIPDQDQDGAIRFGMSVSGTPLPRGVRLSIGHNRQDRLRLDGTYASTTGSVHVFDVVGTQVGTPSVFGYRDGFPEFESLTHYGFRTRWIDILGDATPDMVNLTLQDGPGMGPVRRLWVYDGADLSSTPVLYSFPYGSTDHPADAFDSGDLLPTIGRAELLLGDNRWGPGLVNLYIGRVLIAFQQ